MLFPIYSNRLQEEIFRASRVIQERERKQIKKNTRCDPTCSWKHVPEDICIYTYRALNEMSTEQFVIIGNGSSVNKAPTLDLCWILLAFVIHNRLYRHNQCSLNSLDVVDVARSIDNINSTWYKAECVERDGTATEGRDEWAKSGRVAKSIIANWRLDLITPLVSPLLDKYKITGPVDHVNIAAKSNSHLLPPIAPPPRNGNLFLIFLPTQCSAALKKRLHSSTGLVGRNEWRFESHME